MAYTYNWMLSNHKKKKKVQIYAVIWMNLENIQFSSFPHSSFMSDSLQPHELQHSRLSISKTWSLLKLMPIVMPSSHLIFCYPLLFLPSIFPTIRIFSNESVLCITWLKYWSFSFSISPSNEYSGLISFKMDWFDLLAVLFYEISQL